MIEATGNEKREGAAGDLPRNETVNYNADGAEKSSPGADGFDAAQKLADAIGNTSIDEETPETKRKPLSAFRRDLEQKNVLIKGRWGVRGSVSMHVSSTGSGKSVLQTQSALCFAAGVDCCGLSPVRPFKSWVIQAEDDDDRVAIDRDDILTALRQWYPDTDWTAAADSVEFCDYTGKTGADFLEQLRNDLARAKAEGRLPDALIINPFNCYLGGDICKAEAVGAFFHGGMMSGKDTGGLNKIIKDFNVWCWIFAHTGKPPTAKELEAWLKDEYAAYKMKGASEIADTVRSIITFLHVPDMDGVFAFSAAKNGGGLGWTDGEGKPTKRQYYAWADDGRHYWRGLSPDEKAALADGQDERPKKQIIPPRDKEEDEKAALAAFIGLPAVGKTAAAKLIQDAVNRAREQDNCPLHFARCEAERMRDGLVLMKKLSMMNARNGNGWKYGTPEVIDALMGEQAEGGAHE